MRAWSSSRALTPGTYAAMAAAEGTVRVVLPAERGDILDRNGEPLADSVDGLMVVADPKLTEEDAPAIARFLAERLSVDYIDTLARLRERGSRFEYVARRVPSTLANDVLTEAEARGIEGLSTRRDPVRTYPAHDVAANIIGFMGTDEAFGGLEQVFDKHLSGKDGSARYEVGGGNRIPLGHHKTVAARDGADLTTTIDRDLQWFTQRVLRGRGARGPRRLRDRDRHGLPDRRGPGRRRLPDVRRGEPRGLPDRRPRCQVDQPGLRARVGREGPHPLLPHRRRPDDRAHAVHGAREPGPSGPGDP